MDISYVYMRRFPQSDLNNNPLLHPGIKVEGDVLGAAPQYSKFQIHCLHGH